MSTNLYKLELWNIENSVVNKPRDGSRSKRDDNHRRLAARRAIEDHREQQRLRREFEDLDLEVY